MRGRGVASCVVVLLVTSCAALLPLPEAVFMGWSGRRMLSVSQGGCKLMDDSESITWMSERAAVREIGDNELDYMVEACSVMRRPADNRPSLFLYPGTKWCGSGSVAHGYHDLGVLSAEDRCCRDHDYCPASLRAGQCRGGFCNHSPFTSYRQSQPRYQYHRLAPYSAPLFGGLQVQPFGFASVVPTAISSVLFTVFKFIGAA
ncbi:hypothetical protein B566_EDAN012029 [Ephemera danica]|nr:hypothetical protein B566_EDAN012029 [Ephemera danica]